MENASKALIISGGVLVAILLLTFFTFVISKIGEHTASVYGDLEASEIDEFNQKFLIYDGSGLDIDNKNLKPISFQDVVTIVNLAVDNNRTQRLPTEIEVNVYGTGSTSGDWAKTYANATNDEIFTENIDLVKKDQKFTCEVEIESKLVKKVIIKPWTESTSP